MFYILCFKISTRKIYASQLPSPDMRERESEREAERTNTVKLQHLVTPATHLQIFTCTNSHPRVKHIATDHSVRCVEWIHECLLILLSHISVYSLLIKPYLNIQFPDIHEELSYPIIVLAFVQQHKLHVYIK